AVLATFAYAAYLMATRVLSRADSNETTLFYANFVGAALMLPVAPFFWTSPEPWQFGLMFLAGACASVAHYILIAAHTHAPASLLSSFIYSQLVWVIALGYAVFVDVPDAYTLVGASIVIASGLYVFHRERVRRPRTAMSAGQE